MKARLLRIHDRNRLTMATVIAMLLITVSLVTTGIISALCDLSAFAILLTVLWLKASESKSKNRSYEQLIPSAKIKIEP
ncbi:hypothetical protein [uncultured Photobacterium sp.]|uniref:hypothetical protein n=1 Tax=uncultured Photobacterium sp. TaxID=173973 RepID=UPI00261A5A2B|nr:hypothetical protein [uncultured Photobacterium sp.]